MSTTVRKEHKRRRPSSRLVLLTILAVAIATSIVALALRPSLFGGGAERIDARTIDATFNEIAELGVEEYAYSNVGSYDKEGLTVRGFEVPFTGRDFLVTYDGSVKAGVKHADTITTEIDDGAQTITVWVPHVEVLSSSIDSGSVTVHDQSMNPLNQVRVTDVTTFIGEQERFAEQKAIESGLLDRAAARTEELFSNHVDALTTGTELADYAVLVRWREPVQSK